MCNTINSSTNTDTVKWLDLVLQNTLHYFFKNFFGKPVQQFIINLGNPSLAAKKKTKRKKTRKKNSDYVKTNIKTKAASDYQELNVNASNLGFVY